MAVYYNTPTTYGTAAAVNRFFSQLGDIVGSIEAWNDARLTRKALSALSDRALADIGLVRGDIERVAMNHFIR